MIYKKFINIFIVVIFLCNTYAISAIALPKQATNNHTKQKLQVKQRAHIKTVQKKKLATPKKQQLHAKESYRPPETSLIIDAKTGKILHAQNVSHHIYPASLTKVMTLYMLFDALESGRIKPDQKLFISQYATEAEPSKLYLKSGDYITAQDAALGLIVKSANDVARVVAENIGGSEARFAKLMTAKARQLGMKNTTFKNASGLHNPQQISTAADLAKLTLAIKRDFPEYYPLFASNRFEFKGRMIKGHNKVSEIYAGAEGLKTGYTLASGCNLITTATRGNKSLIGVVTGVATISGRDEKMMDLLDQHFGQKYYVSRDVVKQKPMVAKKKGASGNKKRSVKIATKAKPQSRAVARG